MHYTYRRELFGNFRIHDLRRNFMELNEQNFFLILNRIIKDKNNVNTEHPWNKITYLKKNEVRLIFFLM